MFFNIRVLKNFATGKTPVLESLFKLKIPTQVFSCEYCDVLRTDFLIEHLRCLLLTGDEVTVQFWASADLLFLIKKTMWDGFY